MAHYSDDFGPWAVQSTRDPPFSGAGELSKDPELAEEDGGQRFFDENGQELDPTFLDVTDRVNQAFIYPLSSEVKGPVDCRATFRSPLVRRTGRDSDHPFTFLPRLDHEYKYRFWSCCDFTRHISSMRCICILA